MRWVKQAPNEINLLPALHNSGRARAAGSMLVFLLGRLLGHRRRRSDKGQAR